MGPESLALILHVHDVEHRVIEHLAILDILRLGDYPTLVVFHRTGFILLHHNFKSHILEIETAGARLYLHFSNISYIGTMPNLEADLKFLGSSKVSSKLRISLVKEAADQMDIEDGDHILFYKNNMGQIVIKKG